MLLHAAELCMKYDAGGRGQSVVTNAPSVAGLISDDALNFLEMACIGLHG